jgi:hypothetical protein
VIEAAVSRLLGPAYGAREGGPGGTRPARSADLPGAVAATAGVAALVYGLSNAATTPDGVSHWGDAKVIAAPPQCCWPGSR